MAEPSFDFVFILAGFLVASAIVTFFLKKYFNAQTFAHIFSMIKTTRPLWVFDALSKPKRFWTILANIGLVLGFGAIAIDFLFGSKKSRSKRILVFLLSFLGMSAAFFLFDTLTANSISNNYFLAPFFVFMAFFFGLAGFSGLMLLLLAANAVEIIHRYLIGEKACPGVAPLIPGVEIPNVPFTVPLYVWIPLFMILVIHETAHGILARIAKIKVKSTGVLLLGFLPIGAFVEPDDKETEEKPKKDQLRLFSAGVSANLAAFALTIVGLLALSAVLSAALGPWLLEIRENSFEGVQIVEVFEKVQLCGSFFASPAFGEIQEGSRILEINGNKVKYTEDVISEIAKTRFLPTTFLLEKDGMVYEKTLSPNELGSFGIRIKNITNEAYFPPQEYLFYSQIHDFFFEFWNWFFLLNFLIALVNFLPVPVFDGGRISTILLTPYLGFLKKTDKEKERLVQKIFIIVTLVLMIINFLPVIF